LRRADLPSEECYRLCIELGKLKGGQSPTKSCGAINNNTTNNNNDNSQNTLMKKSTLEHYKNTRDYNSESLKKIISKYFT
jgi:hypothetical protein